MMASLFRPRKTAGLTDRQNAEGGASKAQGHQSRVAFQGGLLSYNTKTILWSECILQTRRELKRRLRLFTTVQVSEAEASDDDGDEG